MKTYYIVKRSSLGDFLTGNNADYQTALTSYGGRKDAGQFATVADALSAVEYFGRTHVVNRAKWYFQLIRVEETISAPRRELVTTGDLSLLDKGPVVVLHQSRCSEFVRAGFTPTDSWTGYFSQAQVFENQTEAIEQVRTILYTTRFRIVPIREIPGETIVTETVLA